MARIKGIDVTLYEKTKTGEDAFNKAIYTENAVTVHNVLVGQPTAQEIQELTDLYGKKAVYTLAIPKGDTHNWEDCRVSFFSEDYHVFGIPLKGIECDIPLDWNMKVTVERYE